MSVRGHGKELKLEQTFIGTGGDGDLGVRVQSPSPEGRVSVRQGLLETRPAPGWGILVAVDAVEGLLGGVEDKVWRVVAEEALTHVDNGLDW
jgi:hypothetical protein